MYSVIIPTMWIPETFCDQLRSLCIDPNVSEIIIINNQAESTPKHSILLNSKIRMINQEKNIFVNPAWNLGVSLATNNQICILNDDLLFDTKVFGLITEEVLLACGLVGINMFDFTGDLRYNSIKTDDHPFGFGCMMFIHKSRYLRIPEQLRVMYGDSYLITRLRTKYPLMVVNGLNNNGVVSATCRNSEVSSIIGAVEQSETEYWNYMKDNYDI